MNAFWEIFTLLTGILYIILEIRQHNFMWIVGVLTSVAAMCVFFSQSLYASFCLNCYYLAVSFVGLWQWRRDIRAESARSIAEHVQVHDELTGESASNDSSGHIRLRPMSLKVAVLSLAVFAVSYFAFAALARILGDPMSGLDVTVTVMSAIATWWLTRCYKEQWLLWIVADSLASALCAFQHLWWMTVLYALYALSAVYGYCHWRRRGHEIS